MHQRSLLLAAALSLALGGCTFREVHYHVTPTTGTCTNDASAPGAAEVDTVYAATMPPDPRTELMLGCPHSDWVWIDGFWNWDGQQWVWIDGYCMPDMVGYVYVEPYYAWEGDMCLYIPGHWDLPGHLGPGVRIRDHRDGRPRTVVIRDHRQARPPERPNTRVPARPGGAGGHTPTRPDFGRPAASGQSAYGAVPGHRPPTGPTAATGGSRPARSAYPSDHTRYAPPKSTPPPRPPSATPPSRTYRPSRPSRSYSGSYSGSYSSSRPSSSSSRSSGSYSSGSHSSSSPSRSSGSHSSSSSSRSSSSHSSSSPSRSSSSSSHSSSGSHSSSSSHSSSGHSSSGRSSRSR